MNSDQATAFTPKEDLIVVLCSLGISRNTAIRVLNFCFNVLEFVPNITLYGNSYFFIAMKCSLRIGSIIWYFLLRPDIF